MSTELAQIESNAEQQTRLYALAKEQATDLANSTLVPKEYQKNPGNCLIAMNMAKRIGSDVLQTMQSLYVVHGKPSWSSSFLIACFNSCGKFSRMRFEMSGEGMDYGCHAVATELSTGEVLQGTRITRKMVADEGWSEKAGSKWKTMPEQMLKYRAAAFFIRVYAPEISLGMHTVDEAEDTVDAVSFRTVSKGKAAPIAIAAEMVGDA